MIKCQAKENIEPNTEETKTSGPKLSDTKMENDKIEESLKPVENDLIKVDNGIENGRSP